MSNLSNVLLAFLAVLLLSKKLRAEIPSALSLTLVKDINDFKKYAVSSPAVVWKPFEYIEGKGFVLGNENSGGSLVASEEVPVLYRYVNGESSVTLFNQETVITFIQLRLKENIKGAKAVVAAGGIGRRFATVVVEVPESTDYETIYLDVYGRNVEHAKYIFQSLNV